MATYYPHGVKVDVGELTVGANVITNPLDSDTAGKAVSAVGGTAITGAGTVASGLTTVDQAVVSLVNVGAVAGDPFIVTARPSSGNVILEVFQLNGAKATNAGTVHFIAYGTR